MEILEVRCPATDVFSMVAGAAGAAALVATMTNPDDVFTVTMPAAPDDSTAPADLTPATPPTEEEAAAASQYFVAVTTDPSLQPTAPVGITLPNVWQPSDGLTSDPTTTPTGGNGAFAKPLSGTNAQGQGAQGSSGLANTPHASPVNPPDPSGTGANSSSQGQQGASAASFVQAASTQTGGTGQATSDGATISAGSSTQATTSTPSTTQATTVTTPAATTPPPTQSGGSSSPSTTSAATLMRTSPSAGGSTTTATPAAAFGQLPLAFEPNVGQVSDSGVQYLAHGPGSTIALNATGATLGLQPSSAGAGATTVGLHLQGSNANATAEPLQKLPGISNYFLGNDPSQWHTNIPTYAAVQYRNVYAGIDLQYYGTTGGQLEYTFAVRPGGNPGAVALTTPGATPSLDAQGNLVLHTSAGDLTQQAPTLYQRNADGSKQVVAGAYQLNADGSVGFRVGAYDSSRTLYLDPVFSYNSSITGAGNAIAVDGSGNAYIAGQSGNDVYVTKLNSAGSAVYTNTLGGTGTSTQTGTGIAVDSSGDAYLAGWTTATNFPTTSGAYQSSNAGGKDAFVTELNASGDTPIFSTYFGGSSDDWANAIALDGSGRPWITGGSDSSNLPQTINPPPPPPSGQNAFFAGLTASGAGLYAAQYVVPGSTPAEGRGIAVDGSGQVDLAGWTTGSSTSEAFVAAYKPSQPGVLQFDQTLGGNGGSYANALAVDASNNIYLTGATAATDFPTTTGAPQTANAGGTDAFVTEVNSSGTTKFSTYLGGSGNDAGNGIAVDSQGGIVVTGATASSNFPAVASTQSYGGGAGDAFVARYLAGALVWSSFLGQTNPAQGNGVAVDGSNAVYLTGTANGGMAGFAGKPIAPPVVVNQSYTFAHDATTSVSAAQGLLVGSSDPSGHMLTATLVAPATHGTVTVGSDGSFVYTPSAGSTGSDSFTFKANDGTQDSNTATVNLTIIDAHAPVAVMDNYSVLHDQVLAVDAASGVLANDSDADNDALTANLVSGPGHGTLTLNQDGSFVYTPTAGYVGTDSFEYTASDGVLQSSATTVNLTVTDQAPQRGSNTYYAVTENTALVVGASTGLLEGASDADGDALTASLVSGQGPNHGTITINADGSFTYTPATGYTGGDGFSYQISDGAETTTGLVTLTIHALSSPPTAQADAYTLSHDRPLSTTVATGLLANDTPGTPGDLLMAALVNGQGPTHGSLTTFNYDGSFTYTPDAGYVGSDSFQYVAYEGTLSSSATTVSLSIDDPNAPVAVADSYSVERNNVLTVTSASGVLANDTDADGDPLTASVVSGQGPAHGTLSFNSDGSFTYTPTSSYVGSDSFQYQASDGALSSRVTTVALTVSGRPPVANNDAFIVSENTALTAPAGALTGNDSDPDNLPFTSSLATGPTHGNVTVNGDGSFTYTPTTGYTGPDSFTYTDSDGGLVSSPATVTITVEASNTLPTAGNVSYTVNHDSSLSVDASAGVLSGASDPDGDPLLATQVTGPSHGTLAFNNDGSFSYTPSAGYYGSDSFTFQAFDGTGYSTIATASITVAETAPVANNDLYSVAANAPLTVDNTTGVLANDTDAEGDPLTASVVSNPAYGTVTLNSDGSFTYTPGSNFPGSDSFTYTASDGILTSNTATVTLTAGPVAGATYFGVNHDTPLTVDATDGVLYNASDADGDPLTASLVSQPSNGSLTFKSDGSFTYTPNYHFVGTDSFQYTVSDGTNVSNTATATISVTNDAPEGVDVVASTAQNTTLTVAASAGVLSNSFDPDGDPLTAQLLSGPAHGILNMNSAGGFTYIPDPGYFGTDSFTAEASDGLESSNAITVGIAVDEVIPNNTGSQAVAVGDFTGNGNQDIAVGNSGANTVSIFLGNGNGAFTQQQDLSVSGSPIALAVGDFSGDGKQDLVVATSSSNTISIFQSNGDGTFTLTQTLSLTAAPTALAVGEFTSSGHQDLAVTSGSAVSIYTGNGDGTFTAGTTVTTGTSASGVAVYDFNGDGKQDLAVTNAGAGTVSVLLGNGNGTFASPVNYTVGSNPDAVAVGDFNSDEVADLAVANGGDGTVSILLGNGDGTFGTATSYAVGSDPVALAVGDLAGVGNASGDGDSDLDDEPDLVIANKGSNTLTVLSDLGSDTLAGPITLCSIEGPKDVKLGKFGPGGGEEAVAPEAPGPGVGFLLAYAPAPPRVTVPSPTFPARAVAYAANAANAQRYAASDGAGNVKVYWYGKANASKPVLSIPTQTKPIDALALSPDSDVLATKREGAFGVLLWKVTASSIEKTGVVKSTSFVYSVAFNPNGGSVLVGNRSELIMANRETGAAVKIVREHTQAIKGIATSSLAVNLVATASLDKTVKLFTGTNLALLSTLSIGEPAASVSISPDGKKLAVGTELYFP